MTDNKVRLSQVVGVYGPGAMLDLPDRSVLVMGLDHWDMRGKDTFKLIEEPRLQRLLYARLANEEVHIALDRHEVLGLLGLDPNLNLEARARQVARPAAPLRRDRT